MNKLVFIIFLFSVACQTNKKNQRSSDNYLSPPTIALTETPNKLPNLKKGILITNFGENYSPYLFQNKLYYVSKDRLTHKQPQVYEKNFITSLDRRITYQDGIVDSPKVAIIDSKEILFYTSTTDEIKENFETTRIKTNIPYILIPVIGELHPSEIYISLLSSDDIQRITNSRFFDGFFDINHQSMYFSSQRNNDFEIYKYDLAQKKVSTFSNSPQKIIFNFQPSISPDFKTLVWIQYNSEKKKSEIIIGKSDGKTKELLKIKEGLHLYPQLFPKKNALLFSSNFEDENNFDIYLYDVESKCLSKFIDNPGIDSQPIIDSDEKFVYFTNNSSGNRQIYKYQLPNFEQPNTDLTCLELK